MKFHCLSKGPRDWLALARAENSEGLQRGEEESMNRNVQVLEKLFLDKVSIGPQNLSFFPAHNKLHGKL